MTDTDNGYGHEYFHSFVDERDEYFDITILGEDEAEKQAREWIANRIAEGYNTGWRIYHQKENKDTGDQEWEDCIDGDGYFPH